MKAVLSIAVFVLAYCLIASEKINKTIVAVLGASCVLFLGLVTFEEAVAAIDFNVVFLLVGMMTCVYILSKTGFFEWVAISVAKRAKGDPGQAVWSNMRNIPQSIHIDQLSCATSWTIRC